MMKTQTDAEIAKMLQSSLQSTSKGLAVFANSLAASGFSEAAPKYRQLEIVLIQQRLWCKNKGRDEFAPLWREISKTAHQIDRAIGPLSEIMGQLAVLETFTEGKKPTPQEKETLKVLSTPQPISLAKLSKLLNKEKKTVAEEMAKLAKNGFVKVSGRGNGRSYCLIKEA